MCKKNITLLLLFILFIYSILVIFSLSSANSYSYPIKDSYIITSYYGHRILFGKDDFHTGVDFAANEGTPVYAVANGVISSIGFTNIGGNYITILHENGYKSYYGHLSTNHLVTASDYVYKGEQISTIGPKYLENGRLNGMTTGCHLHFGMYDKDGKHFDPLSLNFEK